MIDLDGMSPARFLAGCWQKRPLLARNALPGFVSPIAAEDLAALACTDLVESRLICREGDGPATEVRDGPFDEKTFAALQESHWTLLVQAVDRVVPEVAAVLEHFRFVPNWRLDDVMVSYATDGGGVGAHVDRYDVFLLQGSGRRRWQIEPRAGATDRPVLPGPLPILVDFAPEEEWVLEAGDLLYLPPGVAHRGTAEGACTTYSIGFRAPSRDELSGALLAEMMRNEDADVRYSDADLESTCHPGEIAPEALARARGLIERGLFDEPRFSDWFGRFVTTARRGELDAAPQRLWNGAALRQALRHDAASLRRCATPCFAYRSGTGRQRGSVVLYVCGESFELRGELIPAAPLLCDGAALDANRLAWRLDSEAWVGLLVELVNRGFLILEPGAAAER